MLHTEQSQLYNWQNYGAIATETSMSHNTDPGDPILQPSIHFEHYGSRVHLYNVPEIAAADPGVKLRLYENTELTGELRAVTLDSKIELTDGGPVLAMELVAQLPSDEKSPALGRLQSYVESEQVGRSYTTLHTLYENVVRLNLGMGVEALAWFNEQRQQLFVSNYARLGESGSDRDFVVAWPVLLERLDVGLQLMVMSQFMTELLSYGGAAGGSVHRIGERVTPLASPATQVKLGDIALAASELQSPAPPTDEEVLTVVAHELAADIDDRVRLDDVACNAELKQTLRDVALSFQRAETLAQWGVRRPQGILLHGPPGTGKSMVIQALANEIGAELRTPQSSDIYGKYLGESEKAVKRFFAELRAVTQPTIVLFNELETIINSSRQSSNRSGADNAWNAVAGIFKQELDDLAAQNPNLLLAATTNNLPAVDESLIRPGRFDHVYEIDLPDEAALKDIFASNIVRLQLQLDTATFKIFAPDVNVPELAAAADGLSGAAVVEILRRLRFARAMHQVRTGQVQPIAQADLLQAIDDFE
jgi:ATP-dependent 26S proteasome regulatory subunit